MKTKAAVLWGLHEKWQVEEVELDDPKEHEVLVKLTASGLCRSDVHQNWFETHINGLWSTFENSANDKCLDGSRQYGVRVATCIHTDTHQWWA